jgi:hypothetical protein
MVYEVSIKGNEKKTSTRKRAFLLTRLAGKVYVVGVLFFLHMAQDVEWLDYDGSRIILKDRRSFF